MHTDYFAVPNLTLPVRRGQRPPILRFVAFVMVVLGCLAVDALVLFALYKGGAVLVAQYDPVLLAQGIAGLGGRAVPGLPRATCATWTSRRRGRDGSRIRRLLTQAAHADRGDESAETLVQPAMKFPD